MLRAFMIACQLVSIACELPAESPAYWKAKVSTAIAARPKAVVSPSIEPSSKATATAEKRPVVRMYTASWCGPCVSFKAEWEAYRKKNKTPFDLEYIDADKVPLPPEAGDLIPVFVWQAKGKPEKSVGNQLPQALISKWQATQPQAASRPP